MKNIISFISGFVFSIGLIVSQMINPAKVKGFLDVSGDWDISLMFVMGGAVGINLILFSIILKRKPVLVSSFFLPARSVIDKNLILGSILFGIGWGISGVCPGPSIVNLVHGKLEIFVFVSAMLVGMISVRKRTNNL